MNNLTPVVKQLLILNIICYLGANLLGAGGYELFSLYYFESTNFKIWQPLTHMFMHAQMPQLSHILFNMFGLVSFGAILENFWGGKRFLIYYILCGLGATAFSFAIDYYQIHHLLDKVAILNLNSNDLSAFLNSSYESIIGNNGQLVNGHLKTVLENANCSQEQFNILLEVKSKYMIPSVGASGAIYGLLAAFAVMLPNSTMGMMFIPIQIKAKYFVPIIVAIDLYAGVSGNPLFGQGIGHFAHVGGAVTGLILLFLMRNKLFKVNRIN